MTKLLELEALDGSRWVMTAEVALYSYAQHYGPNQVPDDSELIDWARNEMNWADVKALAVMVKQPDALDMEDSWANGKLRVLDGVMPSAHSALPRSIEPVIAPEVLFAGDPALGAMVRDASEPGDFPAVRTTYVCKRCQAACVAGESIECDRGPCPMEPVAITAHVPKGTVAPASFSKAELIAIYDDMKSEDVLAGVEPGDHGNAIIAAYGQRVVAAVMAKVTP